MAKWDKISSRWNVEDRRWSRVVRWVWGISVAGILVFAAMWYMAWKDPGQILIETLWEVQNSAQTQSVSQQDSIYDGQDTYETFASTVLGSNDALWSKAFAQSGLTYNPPKLVLFRDYTNSACWWADSKYGPHYCSLDSTIYLDETFFDELTKRYWAKWWDVAEAYVIAHEVAHHLQHELWTMDLVNKIRKETPSRANEASVRLELQADCYAGIWAASIAWKWILEKNEVSEAIDAAESVWDDRIQKAATGRINPESWTHGSSADRKKWFNIWYKNSDFALCNTFE